MPTDIVFSQLKAKVSGKVHCILPEDCSELKVILQPSLGGNEIIIDVSANEYVVNDVLPGTYHVSFASNKLCWKNDSYTLSVNDVISQVPTFVQTGYLINFAASHDTKISCTYEDAKSATLNLTVQKGKSSYCIEKSGSYHCTLGGCHFYESNTVSFNMRADNEVHITAQKHLLSLDIETKKIASDIYITVNIDGSKTEQGPLKCINNICALNLFLSSGENAVLVPHSELLYFKPPILSVTGKDDCVDMGVTFVGIEGKVFKGRIIPPLTGVLITLETEKEALMDETDTEGRYKFPPQDASKTYRISAKKDSFVLVGPDASGNFLAHKLAEIVVQVLDSETGLPLQVTAYSNHTFQL